MRVGAMPGGPLEWLLLKMNLIPTPLIDSFSAMMNAKAILAANELGLFNALEDEPLTPRALAGRLGLSVRGTSDLADALSANGYLTRKGERLALSRVARKWLVRSSPHYIGNMLEHVNDLWAVWLNLEEAIRKGEPPAAHYEDWLRDEDYRPILRRHIVGLRDTARLTAPEMLRVVRLKAVKHTSAPYRLLDIGGGHGGYSIAFCEKYPNLTATVFDLERTAEIGREIVEREAMGNRIEFRVGDFLKDDFDTGYAAALYFNILHNFSERDNRLVLEKVFNALNPGGVLAIWDMFKHPGGGRDVQPALMALHMLVASGGTSYLMKEVAGWLGEIGFLDIVQKKARTLPGFTFVIARKPE